MNVPERSLSYVLSPGESKVTDAPDSKTENTGTFTFNKEDHTLGNLLRMQLLRDKEVRFAGYIMPHPLVNRLDLKVMTNDAQKRPKDNLTFAFDDLIEESDNLMKKLDDAVDDWNYRNPK